MLPPLMRSRRFALGGLIAAALIAASLLPAAGQDAATGQFWVQAFEDRDGDGGRGPGEPVITGGLGVSLLNADDIVIATALLDDSPYAAQGRIGFQFLPPGDYTLVIAAPEFTATTPETFTRAIEAGTIPLVVEYGGQRIDLTAREGAAATVATRSLLGLPIALTEAQFAEIGRIAVAALGAVVVAGVMFFLGLFIYTGMLRRKYRREMAALRARYTTDSFAAVQTGTGEYPAARR